VFITDIMFNYKLLPDNGNVTYSILTQSLCSQILRPDRVPETIKFLDSSQPFFSGVCVARYLVFCVLFCRSMFVVLDFVLFLIYIFYLLLWYLPSFLMNIFYLPTVKSDINTRTYMTLPWICFVVCFMSMYFMKHDKHKLTLSF
jgi:hypothetical protein